MIKGHVYYQKVFPFAWRKYHTIILLDTSFLWSPFYIWLRDVSLLAQGSLSCSPRLLLNSSVFSPWFLITMFESRYLGKCILIIDCFYMCFYPLPLGSRRSYTYCILETPLRPTQTEIQKWPWVLNICFKALNLRTIEKVV